MTCETAADVLRHPLYDASFDRLVDLRGARLGLSPPEVEALVTALEASDPQFPGYTAVVVTSPRDTALALLYGQRATAHTKVFSTEEAAYEWLGSAPGRRDQSDTAASTSSGAARRRGSST